MEIDYYEILEISRTADKESIKKAYRKLALQFHPDRNQGDSEAESKFKDINEAYRVLSTGSTKRRYDRMWNTHVGRKQIKKDYEESTRSKDSVFSEFFNMFFGTNQQEEKKPESKVHKKFPIKGENIETEITVGIEDAYFGTEKKISLRTVNRKNENFLCKNSIRN